MRFANRALSVGGLLLALTGLAGCGSSGSLLTADQANELKGQLSQVSQSLGAHQCQQAANQITNLRSTVDGLSVDQSLVSNLEQGLSRLTQLASKECPVQSTHHTTTQATTTATTPPVTTTTQTATTPTTPTQTATTPTTPTQTTTTQTTTGPGSGGVGVGGGQGNGGGNGQAGDKGPGPGAPKS